MIKIFDGPQNIFLCSVFVIFFVKEVGAQNIQTSHQGDLRKTRHVSRYKANSSKNSNKKMFHWF